MHNLLRYTHVFLKQKLSITTNNMFSLNSALYMRTETEINYHVFFTNKTPKLCFISMHKYVSQNKWI